MKTKLISIWKETHEQLKVEAVHRKMPMTELVNLMVASAKIERENYENRNAVKIK